MADENRPEETVEERRARKIAEAKAKLAAKTGAGGNGHEVDEKRGPGTVSASAEGLIEPGARPAGETAADVKAMPEGPGGAVESTVEVPVATETPEQKRARRIAEAKAKLASEKSAEPPPPPAEPPADETPEQRRARKIAEAKSKLAAQKPAEDAGVSAAPPAEETPEQKRARRIAEAKTKLSGQGAAAAPVEPPADETPEQRRARKIAEAKAKLPGKAEPPAAPQAAAPPPATKPAAPKKSRAGAETVDIGDDPLVRELTGRFPGAVVSAIAMVGQPIVTVDLAALLGILRYLRSDSAFDLLLDLTAVHRPDEEPPLEIVYQLVSTSSRRRLRVKAGLADGQPVPSVTGEWPGADWLEREVYDLYGIVFDGHPDLRRILLPIGWEGHPLRKEYPVEFQENAWVRENLNIVEIPGDADFTGKFEA